MRSAAILLIASGLGLFGCAEVRSGGPANPRVPLAGSLLTPGEGGVAEDGDASEVQPADFDEAQDPASDEAEDADNPDAEDDHDEDTEAVDFMACLDRGPGVPPHCPQYTWKSPLEGLTNVEIEQKVKGDLASIGPISTGYPNNGRLFNAVQMPENDHWKMTDPGNAWGTKETVDSITRAIEKVFAKYPESPKVIVGHLSAKGGGRLKPHKSHQAGRDVDLSYFYTDKVGWYAIANDKNLDRARTWLFVKAFVEDPNTEMILVDSNVQRLLYDYAVDAGEDKAFLDRVFQVSGKSQRALIRHAKGHATHIHVRFFSPSAQASGKLAYAYLPKPPPPPKRTKGKHVAKGSEATDVSSKKAKNGEVNKKAPKDEDLYVFHRARSGDTLDSLARRYGVSIQAIKQANGLRSNELKQNKTYRIPKSSGASEKAQPTSGGRAKHK